MSEKGGEGKKRSKDESSMNKKGKKPQVLVVLKRRRS